MKSRSGVSEFPLFPWMLLEVNPCMWDSRAPRQSQMQSAGWGWKGRSDWRNWLGLGSNFPFGSPLAAAEQPFLGLIARWLSREAEKAPSCCDREGRIWKSERCSPHTLIQKDFVLIKSELADNFQEQGVTWGTAGRDRNHLGAWVTSECAHEPEEFTRLDDLRPFPMSSLKQIRVRCSWYPWLIPLCRMLEWLCSPWAADPTFQSQLHFNYKDCSQEFSVHRSVQSTWKDSLETLQFHQPPDNITISRGPGAVIIQISALQTPLHSQNHRIV